MNILPLLYTHAAYDHLMETLEVLKEKEQEIKDNKYNSDSVSMQMIKHYRVICGIGCAAIRCVFSCDWNLVTEHLKNVIENDQCNVGIFRYCLSYSLYKSGQYNESNDHYNYFVKYINKKKTKRQNTKKETEIDEDDRKNDATSELNQLSMDYFKWHPNSHKDNLSEIIDICVDVVVVSLLILLTYRIAGYSPHLGNNLMDWCVIGFMLVVSCLLCSPSLGILLLAISLPPLNEGMPFDYFAFSVKWMCACAGLLFVHRVVIGGEMPRSKLF